jgi:uncharacterized protein YcbX
MTALGPVTELHRYPVKSVLGEAMDAVRVDARGVEGDRVWAVYTDDGGIGSGKNSRRFRKVDGLLHLRATLGGHSPRVQLPDGSTLDAADPGAGGVLSAHLGRPVELRPEGEVPHHDDSPLHLVTTTGLRTLAAEVGHVPEVARFRPNLVVDTLAAGLDDGYPEDAWLGRRLAVGDEVVLTVDEPMPRCVMVDAEQRGLPGGGGVLKALGRVHDVDFGVQLSVVRGGTVRRGDTVRLLPA